MQFELILGFLLTVEVTQVYNTVVLLYNKYSKFYNRVKSILSAFQTTTIDVHDGVYDLDVVAPAGYNILIGIKDGTTYWINTLSDIVSDGVSTWSIAQTGWVFRSICLVDGGWMVSYYGSGGNKRFLLYDPFFIATSTDIVLENSRVVSHGFQTIIGYDGTNVYCTGTDYSDVDITEMLPSGGALTDQEWYYAVSVCNMTTGEISFIDSKMGLIWGSNFYPIDDTMIYASKPIFAPWLHGNINVFVSKDSYLGRQNQQVTTYSSLGFGGLGFAHRLGCIPQGIGVATSGGGFLFFDGVYVYCRCSINPTKYIQKKIF